tara:strand:+ start:490 stop:2112 length:1623 start_codon:yes stop_codon:yes gene_type:complete
LFWRQVVADADAIEESVDFTDVQLEERREFRGSFSGYERDQFFYNLGAGDVEFVRMGYVFGLDFEHDGRSAAPVDIDGDGDLDLALLTLGGLRLLENTTESNNQTLNRFSRVRLSSTEFNRTGLAAVVTLTAGGVSHRDFVKITEGFQTQVPMDIHFGIGNVDLIDVLSVEWPDGSQESWTNLPVDRLIHIQKGNHNLRTTSLPRWPESSRPQFIGNPSKLIKAKRIDGEITELAGDRPAVINFWAPWCAPCNVELPELVEASATYEDQVDFVGVSVELDDLISVNEMLEKHMVPYSQFLIDDNVLANFFGTEETMALPSTFVFDAQNRLRRLFRGQITQTDLHHLLDSLEDEGIFEADLELAARSARQIGDFQTALMQYKRLAELNPTNPQSLYHVGEVALEMSMFGEALDAFERVVKRSPTHFMARFMVGVVQMRTGDVGRAFANLRGALGLAGENAVQLRLLARQSLSHGQLWLAVDALSKAINVEPLSAQSWIERARVHRLRGELGRAADDYREALNVDSENEIAKIELERLRVKP